MRTSLKANSIDVSYIRETYPDDVVLQQFADALEKWGAIIKLGNEGNIDPETIEVEYTRDYVDATSFGSTMKTYLANPPVRASMRLRS